ncbi:hypothetical protein HDE_09378 [Halotydeus destructor]|nr:hypothetical protein HDE_09378 [Halotydeus destructor]
MDRQTSKLICHVLGSPRVDVDSKPKPKDDQTGPRFHGHVKSQDELTMANNMAVVFRKDRNVACQMLAVIDAAMTVGTRVRLRLDETMNTGTDCSRHSFLFGVSSRDLRPASVGPMKFDNYLVCPVAGMRDLTTKCSVHFVTHCSRGTEIQATRRADGDIDVDLIANEWGHDGDSSTLFTIIGFRRQTEVFPFVVLNGSASSLTITHVDTSVTKRRFKFQVAPHPLEDQMLGERLEQFIDKFVDKKVR